MPPMNNRLLRPGGGDAPLRPGGGGAPLITLQLSENGTAAAVEGETITFTSSASGDPEPTAAWQESTDGGNTWVTVQNGS